MPLQLKGSDLIKKVVSLFLVMMSVLAGLLVINIYQTKDQDRIEKIEETSNSYKVYLSNSPRTADETLPFFKRIANRYGLTLIKTDYDGGTVIKSAVVSKVSFPYYEFFARNKKFDLFPNKKTVYVQGRDIPVFWKTERIKLQSIDKFWGKDDKSVNGVYTVIGNLKHRRVVVRKLATFFNTSEKDLLTPKVFSKKEYINRSLMIYLALFLILAVLTVLATFSIPLTNVKQIGVYKLLGLSNLDVVGKLFTLPLASLLGASLIFDIGIRLFFVYWPAGFAKWVLVSQLVVVMIFALSILIALALIRSIRIITLLKQGINFNLGMAITLVIKIATVVLTTVLLIGGLANVKEINEKSRQYDRVARLGSYLTAERTSLVSAEAIRNDDVHNGKNEIKIGRFFNDLEKGSNAYFVSGSITNPQRNLARFKIAGSFTSKDSYQVVRINQNYLKHLGLTAPTGLKNTFYVPIEMKKDHDKVTKLTKLLVLDRSDKSRKDLAKTQVNIVYYRSAPATPVYLNEQLKLFKRPIYELIDSDHLDHWSKLQLSVSGLSNPIRIKNNRHNRALIKRLGRAEYMRGIRIKFATAASLANYLTTTYRWGLLISLILLGVTFTISLVVSAFSAVLYFRTNERELSILRLLGFRVIDRYSIAITLLLSLYAVQIGVACFWGKSSGALLVGVLLAWVDLLVTLAIFIGQENRNIVQVLKGG
ncbi:MULTISPECIES: DUF1430 domain-containing protein [unclassified Lactobacillus]|uniref:DUF1430 domain-containing protein n=1 Tax=unclassified Lactobacillus TaxID=2620435 RepID=UPI0011C382E5|nr:MULTISPECIES: DUF1430 domain-containing protein [unclassified Lactobacillus]